MTERTAPATIDGLPFLRVLGTTPKVGRGTLYTYSVYVEKEIDINRRRFAHRVDAVLADPRSWIRGGKVAFQRVATGAGTQVILARPDTVDKLCYPLNTAGEVSCCQGTKVVINVERWRLAVPHWTGSVRSYREMLVNHEFGHRIGKPHRWCPGPGQIAPVMMQQTYGLQGCREHSWPLDSEL